MAKQQKEEIKNAKNVEKEANKQARRILKLRQTRETLIQQNAMTAMMTASANPGVGSVAISEDDKLKHGALA